MLQAAVELPPAERAQLLAAMCGEDADLRVEVESLLAAHDRAGDFLAPSPAAQQMIAGFREPGRDAVLFDESVETDWEGRLVGPYRLLEPIGAGGMGAVYLAERADREFEKRVAIKLIKRGMDSDEILRRFRNERQLLAGLEHPHIARLLDGGTTDDGLPYLVMEHVDGVPIDRYCEEHRLDTEIRLKLFLQTLEAVSYAHQNLVVHRDLKPNNLLVGGDGRVRVIDFGIAKMLAGDGAESSQLATSPELRLLTPSYASPEQLQGDRITTASDVFSLGVVLYQLLTGIHPFRDPDTPHAELRRRVCEVEPERPSAAVLRSGAGESEPASSALARKLAKRLRGDLDTIILTVLRKEPGRRYATVGELADDVRRHLDGEPVRARPNTLAYRAGKFVRRHALPLSVGVMLLAVAIGGTGLGLRQARQAEGEARREATTSERVTAFLVELFESSDPLEAASADITARELLSRGVERLRGELDAEPLVRARLLEIIGSVYSSLGRFTEGIGLLEESLELRREHQGPDHVDVAHSLTRLGSLLDGAGRDTDAEEVLREALRIRSLRPDGERSETAQAIAGLAGVLRKRGQYEEAERLQRQALAITREVHGMRHPVAVVQINNLALTLENLGRFDEAETLLREALELRRAIYGPEHLRVAIGLQNLGNLLGSQGRAAEAEEMLREALAVYRASVGDEHPNYALALSRLGSQLLAQGRLEDAEQVMREGLSLRRRAYGENNERVASALSNLAGLLRDRGEYDEAEELVSHALAIVRSVQGEDHPAVGFITQQLATIRHHRGERASAIELYRRAIDHLEGKIPAGHVRFGLLYGGLGSALSEDGQYPDAEPMLLASHAILLAAEGPESERVAAAAARLVDLYESLGRPGDAERYRAQD